MGGLLSSLGRSESYREKSAKKITKSIDETYVQKWGNPDSILSDNGKEFTAKRTVKYLEEEGIHQHFTTPCFPQGNGLVERTNQTIMNKAWKLSITNKLAWDYHSKEVLQEYSSAFQQDIREASVTVLMGKPPHEVDLSSREDMHSEMAKY